MLGRNPDLTLKNKKGQSPIDITRNKAIIKLFWNHLSGKMDAKVSEQNKALMGNADASLHKLNLPKILLPKEKFSPRQKLNQKRNGSDGLLMAVIHIIKYRI